MDVTEEQIQEVARVMDDMAVGERTTLEVGSAHLVEQPCWLVVGSGPSATAMIDIALRHPFVQSITTNAGVDLLPDPDYYMIYETEAMAQFAKYVPWLRDRSGTSLVATKARGAKKSLRQALKDLNPEYVIEVAITKSHGSVHYSRGRYTAGGFTGSLMVQFALEHGAMTVMIVGMEGYLSKQNDTKVDTFDGRHGLPVHGRMTKTIYGPMMQLVVNAWPEVQFVYFGKPHYAITGDNVVVIDEEKFDVNAHGSELSHPPPDLPDVCEEAGEELLRKRTGVSYPPAPGPGELGGELRTEGDVPARHDEVEAGAAALD